jgi:transposase
MRLCLDRGFYSKANIDALMGEHMKFLVGLKTSLTYVANAIKSNSSQLRNCRNYDADSGVFGLKLAHTWDFEREHPRTGVIEKTKKRAYLHLFYSTQRALKDECELAQLLALLSRELASGHRRDDHEQHYERYFKRVRGGSYVLRDDVIWAERDGFGHFALLANDAALTAKDALCVYRSKDRIEKAFSDVKNRLDFRTPKVENSETLRGKLICVFIALILSSELRRRMTSAGLYDEYTMSGLIDELDTIERYEAVGHSVRILTVTKKQRDIYLALGVIPLNAS